MNKIFTIAALVAIVFSANAQQEVKFGPKAGVNFATVSDTEGSKMLTAFYVGAVAEIKFNDKFSVQPELVYSAQGVKSEFTILGNTHSGKQKLDYINIPILAKYYIYEGLSIEAGPQFGFLVKADGKGDGMSTSVVSGKNSDNKSDYESFDFSIGAGLAYDFANGFFLNARYNFGLTKINKEKINIFSYDKNYTNKVIQVGVGYKF